MTSKEIKIGVVSEGRTDFVALYHFLGHALERRGISAKIFPIQPAPDNTSNGGWTEVVFWLENNDPAARVLANFGGGMFAGELSEKTCDYLVVHIDSDILDDEAFRSFMGKRGITVSSPASPKERADEVGRILSHFLRLDQLTSSDARKHVVFPAVEATEAWCVAAFSKCSFDPEGLRGQDLWDAFGHCLVKSEGNTPPERCGPPDKDVRRRLLYCERHRSSTFLEPQASQFTSGLMNLLGATETK